MAKRSLLIVCIVTLVTVATAWCADTMSGPYLGQDPPGLTREVFAPGVISVPGTTERSLSLSPQGNELFFTRSNGWPNTKIMHMTKQGGQWSAPQTASFTQNSWGTQAVFSPDGQYLYYSTSRGKSDIRHYSLWRIKKDEDGWAEPENVVDMGAGMMMEFHPTVTRDGSLYFLYWDYAGQTGDIYVSRLIDGQYAEPTILGPPISTPYNEVRPTVEPDGKYLLFESDRPGGYGGTDIYIALKNDDGTWSAPRNLGPTVNTPATDDAPNISPDGKYWFSSVNGDIYWMEARAALPDPNGSVQNLESSLRFGSIQCAITYADPGDTIVIEPGLYTESFVVDKDIVLCSTEPNNPMVIGGTIVQAHADEPVLTLTHNTPACEVAGLTLRTGSVGIAGTMTHATLRNCRVMDNVTHGLELSQTSHPTLNHCLIAANGQTGITMHPTPGRWPRPCEPTLTNCFIIDNAAQSILGGQPTITNSTIED